MLRFGAFPMTSRRGNRRLIVILKQFHVRKRVMMMLRRLARDLQFCAMLACALMLGVIAGARMVGHHASEIHALAALQVLCAEHGLNLPSDPDKEPGKSHSGCPCCPSCPFKIFGAIDLASTGPAWSTLETGRSIGVALRVAPPPARAPPSVSARGPPILI